MRNCVFITIIVVGLLLTTSILFSQRSESATRTETFDEITDRNYQLALKVPASWKRQIGKDVLQNGDFSMRVAFTHDPDAELTAVAELKAIVTNYPPELRKEVTAGELRGFMGISLKPEAGSKCLVNARLYSEDAGLIILAEWTEVPSVSDLAEFEKCIRSAIISER